MEYKTVNKAKASFNEIYNAETPHAYLETMTDLGYRIGDLATPFFEKALGHLETINRTQIQPAILDLGCSYGIGSALLLHDSNYDSLSEYFEKDNSGNVDQCVLEASEWFAKRRCHPGVKCIGMDQASHAIDFGERTGLLEQGIAKNLEKGEKLTSEEESWISKCNLMVSTGAIGYVGPETLSPILTLLGKATPEFVGPVIVTTVLRMFDTDRIASCFQDHDFRFEKVSTRPLAQRNFESEEEQERTMSLLKERDFETNGLESTGVLYADVYAGARDPDFEEFFDAVSKAEL